MVRGSVYAAAAIAFGMMRDPGCGGVDDDERGPNAPCTRSSDCRSGLSCVEGVCKDPVVPPRDAGDEGG